MLVDVPISVPLHVFLSGGILGAKANSLEPGGINLNCNLVRGFPKSLPHSGDMIFVSLG